MSPSSGAGFKKIAFVRKNVSAAMNLVLGRRRNDEHERTRATNSSFDPSIPIHDA
jgi:hypothetical protein